jgi:hypothetical protein
VRLASGHLPEALAPLVTAVSQEEGDDIALAQAAAASPAAGANANTGARANASPAAPAGASGAPGRQYTLRVTDYTEVEPILAALRTSGAVIDDMQLKQADLEDVFLQIVGGGK